MTAYTSVSSDQDRTAFDTIMNSVDKLIEDEKDCIKQCDAIDDKLHAEENA